MAFRNEQLHLPDATTPVTELHYQPLPRAALMRELVLTLASIAAITVAVTGTALFLIDSRWLAVIPLIIGVVVATLAGLLTVTAFRRRGWALRQHDLTYRQGVITQQTFSVPFRRIQHATVRQSLTDRPLGLASLEIFTAGGIGRDLAIDGLTQSTADRLKDHLLDTAALAETPVVDDLQADTGPPTGPGTAPASDLLHP